MPGTEATALTGWAARAGKAGFSTLGTIGRHVYDSYEEMIALSAAAAVTSRIRLTTSVLLAPLYSTPCCWPSRPLRWNGSPTAGSYLGLGLGGRGDDFSTSSDLEQVALIADAIK